MPKMKNHDIRRINKEKAEHNRAQLTNALLIMMVERAGGELVISNLSEFLGRQLTLNILPAPARDLVTLTVIDHDKPKEKPDGAAQRQRTETEPAAGHDAGRGSADNPASDHH